MYQLLIKITHPKCLPQNHKLQLLSQQSPTNETYQNNNHLISTTLSPQQQPHKLGHQSQTPLFTNRVKDLDYKIEAAEISLQNVSQKGRSSDFEQLSEIGQQQLHPMILSHINNPRWGINKPIYLRLFSTVSEMKQIHFQLSEYLQDQKRLIQDFQEKLCFHIQEFFSQFRQQSKANKNQQELLRFLKNQNGILRQRIERKQIEYQRIATESSSFKNIQQKKKTLQSTVAEQNQKQECAQCKDFSIQVHQLESELQKKHKQTEKLIIENQQLQEHIFDLEQKVAGVDLEVEQKLKKQIMLLAELRHNPNSKANQKLKFEFYELQHKCHQMELVFAQHKDISQQLQQLRQKQKQLKQLQTAIRVIQHNCEQLRQTNQQREHQILETQQNLSRKLNKIRSKESELSQWEAELTRKARDSSHQDAPIKQSSELRVSRQISLKSFGKSPQEIMLLQDQFEPKIPQRFKILNKQIEHCGKYKQLLQYQKNSFEKRVIERKQQPENDFHNIEHVNTFNKKINMTLNNFHHQQREPSPYLNIVGNRSRVTQNGYNSSNYRELSKNSRHSAAKSMKKIYHFTTTPHTKTKGEVVPLSGLGGKLEKLRKQIKKQIESIK